MAALTARSPARRLDQVFGKATTRLADGVAAAGRTDLVPINLATARPNFDTPAAIKRAAHEAIDVPLTYMLYSEARGLRELREAVAAKLASENALHIDPASQLLITAGTHEALTVAMQAAIDPGDEVVLFDPSWVAYQGMVRLAGGQPVFCTLSEDGRLDLGALAQVITPRTKALLFTNPNNPTGTVFTPEELGGIRDLAVTHDLLVVVDEIYEYFLFDGRRHLSIASLPGMQDRTLTVNGVSKAFAMTGWRVGYAAGPTWWIDAMLLVHQHVISAPCSFAQKGAVAAFGSARTAVAPMIETYTRRRDLLAAGFASLPDLDAPLPEGACFFFLGFPGELSSEELSSLCWERTGLLLTPGSAFGPSSEGRLRLSFSSLPDELLPEVLVRLETFLRSLPALSPHGLESA